MAKQSRNVTAEVAYPTSMHVHLSLFLSRMADNENERTHIVQLFNCGFSYEDIMGILSKGHGIYLSLRILKRCLKDYGLSRKCLE